MASAHERPAGLWHAEWTALPSLFGFVSGALREARLLAEGLVVYPDRMRATIDLTRGLLFADAAAGRLARQARPRSRASSGRTSGRRSPPDGATLADVLARNPAVQDAVLISLTLSISHRPLPPRHGGLIRPCDTLPPFANALNNGRSLHDTKCRGRFGHLEAAIL